VSFIILLEHQAEKELRSLPRQVLQRIDKLFIGLSKEPLPRGALKLKGKSIEFWRIRIGQYRVLYVVDERKKTIKVYHIKHRKEAYR